MCALPITKTSCLFRLIVLLAEQRWQQSSISEIDESEFRDIVVQASSDAGLSVIQMMLMRLMLRLNRQGHYPVQGVLVFSRVGEADALEGQHRGWQLVCVRELKVERAVVLHWRRKPSSLHLIKNLLLTLGLLDQVGVRSCDSIAPSHGWPKQRSCNSTLAAPCKCPGAPHKACSSYGCLLAVLLNCCCDARQCDARHHSASIRALSQLETASLC